MWGYSEKLGYSGQDESGQDEGGGIEMAKFCEEEMHGCSSEEVRAVGYGGAERGRGRMKKYRIEVIRQTWRTCP